MSSHRSGIQEEAGLDIPLLATPGDEILAQIPDLALEVLHLSGKEGDLLAAKIDLGSQVFLCGFTRLLFQELPQPLVLLGLPVLELDDFPVAKTAQDLPMDFAEEYLESKGYGPGDGYLLLSPSGRVTFLHAPSSC
jgi:hypothetical protein